MSTTCSRRLQPDLAGARRYSRNNTAAERANTMVSTHKDSLKPGRSPNLTPRSTATAARMTVIQARRLLTDAPRREVDGMQDPAPVGRDQPEPRSPRIPER